MSACPTTSGPHRCKSGDAGHPGECECVAQEYAYGGRPCRVEPRVVELEQLAAEIRQQTPPAQLRLAADLLERGRGDLAHMIAEPVVLELGAALALRQLGGRRG